jgi:RIO kinase 1
MVKITREKFKVYQGVFDDFTIDTLNFLKLKKYYDKLGNPIKTGKEGDVYLAEYQNDFRAIKIYRMTTANFKKISTYIQRDFRFKTIKGNMRKVILMWVQKEYRNLILAYNVSMNVPYPFKQSNNVIIMEYIEGDMLKDVTLDNPKEFFDLLLEQMKLMFSKAKLIHGDLSEFNILHKDGIPYIIDWGQGVSIKNEDDLKQNYELFVRDVENVCRFFSNKYSLNVNVQNIIYDIKNFN